MGNLAFAELAQLTSPKSVTKGGLFSDLASSKDLISFFLQREMGAMGGMVKPGVPALRAKRKDITSPFQDAQMPSINIK